MKRIYLACPYSHSDKKIEQRRFEIATLIAGEFMEQGDLVYSPLTHGHTLCQLNPDLGTDFEAYKAHCLSFIEHWATELVVIEIDGYKESVGVQAEIKFAHKCGIPVKKIIDYQMFVRF